MSRQGKGLLLNSGFQRKIKLRLCRAEPCESSSVSDDGACSARNLFGGPSLGIGTGGDELREIISRYNVWMVKVQLTLAPA